MHSEEEATRQFFDWIDAYEQPQQVNTGFQFTSDQFDDSNGEFESLSGPVTLDPDIANTMPENLTSSVCNALPSELFTESVNRDTVLPMPDSSIYVNFTAEEVFGEDLEGGLEGGFEEDLDEDLDGDFGDIAADEAGSSQKLDTVLKAAQQTVQVVEKVCSSASNSGKKTMAKARNAASARKSRTKHREWVTNMQIQLDSLKKDQQELYKVAYETSVALNTWCAVSHRFQVQQKDGNFENLENLGMFKKVFGVAQRLNDCLKGESLFEELRKIHSTRPFIKNFTDLMKFVKEWGLIFLRYIVNNGKRVLISTHQGGLVKKTVQEQNQVVHVTYQHKKPIINYHQVNNVLEQVFKEMKPLQEEKGLVKGFLKRFPPMTIRTKTTTKGRKPVKTTDQRQREEFLMHLGSLSNVLRTLFNCSPAGRPRKNPTVMPEGFDQIRSVIESHIKTILGENIPIIKDLDLKRKIELWYQNFPNIPEKETETEAEAAGAEEPNEREGNTAVSDWVPEHDMVDSLGGRVVAVVADTRSPEPEQEVPVAVYETRRQTGGKSLANIIKKNGKSLAEAIVEEQESENDDASETSDSSDSSDWRP